MDYEKQIEKLKDIVERELDLEESGSFLDKDPDEEKLDRKNRVYLKKKQQRKRKKRENRSRWHVVDFVRRSFRINR
ncbi:Hypothetical predicted protein [Octopus vulgaris]|uniref:Uncharacterized protein n=1 Tax=Octopus vulgaris TaxID=6645 RepID=A0AA36AHR0_OCTVU|nr:Hypothetical predicted protein [Octopus vulgaris]